MDSEHRHELKTNELADWLGHLPDFWHKNARTIIGVVLIIAAGIVFVYARRTKADASLAEMAQATAHIQELDSSKGLTIRSLQEGKQAPDTMIVSANALEMAAENAKSPNVAALLLIKRGEALRSDLHYAPEEVDADIVADRIETARTAYDKALQLAEGNNTLTAMARMGLALCAEEIGDYIKAEEIYKSIIADEAYAGTVFGAQAQDRLDNMADNRMRFEFAKAPSKPVVPDIKIPRLTTPPPGATEETTTTPVEEVTINPDVTPEDETTPVETEDSAETEKANEESEMK